MENFKLNDIVTVSSTHEKKSYYNNEYSGLVVFKSDHKLTIKKADGDTYDYDLQSDSYTYKVDLYSEFEYQNDIDKEVKRLIDHINTKKEDLANMMKWRQQFKFEISLVGKLMGFIKSYNLK